MLSGSEPPASARRPCQVSWLWRDFETVGTFPTGGSSPRSVTVGDFNADGKSDLAVANVNTHTTAVGVLLGNCRRPGGIPGDG